MMKTKPEISVCIFTLNPDPDFFRQVIKGIKEQTFALSRYEIVIVDNGSEPPVSEIFFQDLAWHPAVIYSVEPQKGFTYANRKLFEEANSDIIVILGDDCVLAPDYLEKVNSILSEHLDVGVVTGSICLHSEYKANGLMRQFLESNYWSGNFTGYVETQIRTRFTAAMRGSAGMAVRKNVGKAFLERFWIYPEMMAALQQANLPFNLHYEDLDLAMHAMYMNYKIARSGELQLSHLLSEKKGQFRRVLKREYLTGFFLEFFYLRWNWYPYNKSSMRAWGRLLRTFIFPFFPFANYLVRLSHLFGGLQARFYIINHQNLIGKVSIEHK